MAYAIIYKIIIIVRLFGLCIIYIIMHVIISNTLRTHLTSVYRVFYVPGIICRVSLASPTPIQLMGKMLILYLFVFFKLVIMVAFAVTLH